MGVPPESLKFQARDCSLPRSSHLLNMEQCGRILISVLVADTVRGSVLIMPSVWSGPKESNIGASWHSVCIVNPGNNHLGIR